MLGQFIAIMVISGCPIAAVVYGMFVITDDDFVSDYSDTFLGGK